MNKALTLIMILLFANLGHSQNNYNALWQSVAKFEVQGLPKSALDVVETISEKADKDNNNVQRIKALLFKSKFALTLEEDAQLTIINSFKSQIATSEFPTKNKFWFTISYVYSQNIFNGKDNNTKNLNNT